MHLRWKDFRVKTLEEGYHGAWCEDRIGNDRNPAEGWYLHLTTLQLHTCHAGFSIR